MLAKPLLFLSSYAVLFALLAIRIDQPAARWTMAGLSIAGILSLILILRLNKSQTRAEHTISEVSNAGSEAAAYLAGYLLPFLVVANPTAADWLAYALFLIVALVINVRTGIIQVNPLLFLLGYSIYKVKSTTGATFYIVARGRLLPGEQIRTTSLSDEVRVLRKA
ncbi:hypothetical protein [Leifsonia soli]|uniref:Uncharacterized protein n=1 Tax=Leifsonia soli TaxID=582665 RepID=A0A852T3M3_9MICO|nr:hypothetical protein [Leifsonia soli]NYD76119.1 hypothetical protein [Leifsonia soli]